jgi:hypothetical protein
MPAQSPQSGKQRLHGGLPLAGEQPASQVMRCQLWRNEPSLVAAQVTTSTLSYSMR